MRCSSMLKFVLAIVLGSILTLPAAAQPEIKEAVGTDANGDPLPPEALAISDGGAYLKATPLTAPEGALA